MKKYYAIIVLIFTSISALGQKTNFNVKGGYVAEGYDVVAYFDSTAVKGQQSFAHTYEGANFLFSSETNLNKFRSYPKKYIPQYGGWCAYAIGKNGKKVKINPETYEIRDNKLYLFYNFRATNTLESWLSEGATALKEKADTNWKKIIDKH
ncbi:YHS domain-containing (seleno)protein [Spongiimicrobium sp. 3-5]|uniref:YHS domain-containing (seleno)protein n=1 Tax=Spongiimicrobium sp. 3-5 TaxID=3332596 RepID=UPI0039811341